MRPQAQTSLEETTIENPTLEEALEKRERQRQRAAAARKSYREADERAKVLVDDLSLDDDAPIRVGRFVLSRHRVSGRMVAFETDPSTRLTIRLVKEDEL